MTAVEPYSTLDSDDNMIAYSVLYKCPITIQEQIYGRCLWNQKNKSSIKFYSHSTENIKCSWELSNLIKGM